jgi:hypothetical protein
MAGIVNNVLLGMEVNEQKSLHARKHRWYHTSMMDGGQGGGLFAYDNDEAVRKPLKC